MTVVVIDYGSGNLPSAAKLLQRAAAAAGSGQTVRVSADAEEVWRAERIVLPGVGAFADCMRGLAVVPGMVESLTQSVVQRGRPFLGICVGMQLMATCGREHGVHAGFGWIAGEVIPIEPRVAAGELPLKVPHMGWNELLLDRPEHPVLSGCVSGSDVYFAHSYHLLPADPSHRLASVEYGGCIAALVGRDNLVGTQFHPEKSQAIGLRLLANFLQWRP